MPDLTPAAWYLSWCILALTLAFLFSAIWGSDNDITAPKKGEANEDSSGR